MNNGSTNSSSSCPNPCYSGVHNVPSDSNGKGANYLGLFHVTNHLSSSTPKLILFIAFLFLIYLFVLNKNTFAFKPLPFQQHCPALYNTCPAMCG